MIKYIDNSYNLTVPSASFISVFSLPFFDRNREMTIVNNTALFNTVFEINFEKFTEIFNHFTQNKHKETHI